MSSRRKQILSAMETRFKTIAVGVEFSVNGDVYVCASAIGDAVFLRRVEPLDATETEALNVIDGEATATAIAGGFTEYGVVVTIDCLYRNDDGSKAEQAARDVLAAIGSDPYWGGLAESTVLESANLDVQLFDDSEAGFSIPVKITYQVPNWTL
jgi:hypothetical protein